MSHLIGTVAPVSYKRREPPDPVRLNKAMIEGTPGRIGVIEAGGAYGNLDNAKAELDELLEDRSRLIDDLLAKGTPPTDIAKRSGLPVEKIQHTHDPDGAENASQQVRDSSEVRSPIVHPTWFRLCRLLIARLGLLLISGDKRDAEILALRHQILVLNRQIDRPKFTPVDRTIQGEVRSLDDAYTPRWRSG